MVFFNWATMQMAAKIVYYGPGLGGKTTNLSFIYAKTAPGSRGEMVSLETETDRTLFFDLLPIEVGKVAGFRTRLQLYTVPGQVFYNTTRKLVLKGVDGIVFVADSQRPMIEANAESFKNLEENLGELGLEVSSMPLVLQYNKRDLRNIVPIDELNGLLNPDGRWQFHEAVAVDGVGVFDTLKSITKQTLKSLRRRMVAQEGTGTVAKPAAPAPRPVAFNPAGLAEAAHEGLQTEGDRGTGDAGPAAVEANTAEAAPPPAVAETVPESAPETDLPVAEEAAELEPAVETAEAPEAVIVEDDVVPVAVEAEPAPTMPEEGSGEAVEAVDVEGIEAVELDDGSDEEGSGAEVDFDTTPEPAAATEMRRVRVSSSLDILSELENLRKASTWEKPRRSESDRAQPSLDLDSLLQSSLNSRREVRRRFEEAVGDALDRADRCTVVLELKDADGATVQRVEPTTIELDATDSPANDLALILTFNLRRE